MSLDALSGTIGERKLGFDFATGRAITLTSVSFRVQNTQGRGYTVYARHNDAAGQIESWTTHPDPEEMLPVT